MMIKPVFFNSATLRKSERLISRAGSLSSKDFAVRWALLPETPLGPCLIDTGYSRFSTKGKLSSWGLKLYYRLLQPTLLEAGQIGSALHRYDLTEADIAAVIVTHFHVDHISALRIFENARFFTSQIAVDQISCTSKLSLWMKGIFPELLPQDFIDRSVMIENLNLVKVHGFKTYDLFGNGECLALPLPGHARGHFGLLFPHEKLLYAVDCAWVLNSFIPDQKSTWVANRIADSCYQSDDSMQIVRRFKEYGYTIVLCHEPEMGAYDV